jgi:hypothetical protein
MDVLHMQVLVSGCRQRRVRPRAGRNAPRSVGGRPRAPVTRGGAGFGPQSEVDVASGIQSVRRWTARDTNGRPVSILLGHTSDGGVAIGIASDVGDAQIAVLVGDLTKEFRQEFVHAMVRAAGGGL